MLNETFSVIFKHRALSVISRFDFQMAARKSREKKMAKIRYLKTEHVRLSRDHDSILKQRKAAEAESNNWLRRVEKMEGELKRLREM